MKNRLLLVIVLFQLAVSQVYGQNEFYFNGSADVIFKYPPRGAGGRAFVHYLNNALVLNFAGDFTGGTKIGNGFNISNEGDLNFKSWQPQGAEQSDFFIDVVPGTRTLRTRNWNIMNPNIGATGIHTGYAFFEGNVGIGTTAPDEKLTVKGKIHAEEVRVDLNVPGPDYVFKENYQLKSLSEIQAFIKENKHLPEIPSAKEMEEKGINLSEMNMLLLKKVEELTLYILKQEERINKLEANHK
jgi:hypothetical protein